ncbi:hypothetical protein QBC38DRAFT_455367 [Podospora fimiseda]|uniref:Ankyrin repeat protein n=1 Tax=Podospora fimiseda TaxID=252190 RepID=A0AAN7BPU9_9PEZI|nr:hypothetical protein QBC38DRAFT_455367 [Podospora fimiseda]
MSSLLLVSAAAGGKVEEVLEHLDKGFDTSILFDHGGQFLLSIIVEDSCAEVLGVLIQRNILEPTRIDRDGWNILYYACHCEWPKFVDIALEYGGKSILKSRTNKGVPTHLVNN